MVTEIRMLCTLNMLSLFLSVLQHVAVRCSVEYVSIVSSFLGSYIEFISQCVAVCCSALQC